MSTRETIAEKAFKREGRKRTITSVVLTVLTLTSVLLLSSDLLGTFNFAKAETIVAYPPFDGSYGTGYIEKYQYWWRTARAYGYSRCIEYYGQTYINGPALQGWGYMWRPVNAVSGGVMIKIVTWSSDFYTYAGYYKDVYVPEGTTTIKVKATITTLQTFDVWMNEDYRPWGAIYFQVCIDQPPDYSSWDRANIGYKQQLAYFYRYGTTISPGTTWTPEITIDLKQANIGPGQHRIYFGLLAYASMGCNMADRVFRDYYLPDFDYNPYKSYPVRESHPFQFQKVEINLTGSLKVGDPKVTLSFSSPINWILEDDDSSVKMIPSGWAEPSDPNGPTKMAFGDFTKPDLYVQVQGSPGVQMTVTVAFPKEYFWTIDPSDPFTRNKYVEGGSFTVTKTITEDDLRSGWARFTSDKVFRAKPLQGIDYIDVPIRVGITYSGTTKTFTTYARLASIKPEVRQVWLSSLSCVMRVYGKWSDDDSYVKNRPYLYYGLDLESRRIYLKTGIDSNEYGYAESDPIDPQTLRPTGCSVDKQSLIRVTPATDEFTLESGYVEYRELALSVLQRDSNGFKLRVYEFKAPNYSPVPYARVTIIVKNDAGQVLKEVSKTAYSDGTVYFARSELSLPVSGYEVWAIAWGSDTSGIIYARSPFGCILLEKA
jgi:hypothetical protein